METRRENHARRLYAVDQPGTAAGGDLRCSRWRFCSVLQPGISPRQPARGRHSPRHDAAVLVEADSKEAVPDVARQIDDPFADSPYPTKSEPEQAFMLSFVSFLGNLKLFLVAICGAVAFTILLVSANMLSMSVRERT